VLLSTVPLISHSVVFTIFAEKQNSSV